MSLDSQGRIIPSKGIGSVRILLIDDQQSILELLRRILKALGFSLIDTASSGEDALRIVARESVDIIFCDWEMDGMSGLEFTQAIRGHEKAINRFVPIIMLSGRTAMDDIQRARDAGITEFLAKPFTIGQICDRVISVVERPRHFVLAPNFKGPDRRRRGEGADEERRENPNNPKWKTPS